MLDTTEITNLERKWKRYKYKAFFKQSLVGILTLILVSGAVYYYLQNYAPTYHTPLPTPKNTFLTQTVTPEKKEIKPITKQPTLKEEIPKTTQPLIKNEKATSVLAKKSYS